MIQGAGTIFSRTVEGATAGSKLGSMFGPIGSLAGAGGGAQIGASIGAVEAATDIIMTQAEVQKMKSDTALDKQIQGINKQLEITKQASSGNISKTVPKMVGSVMENTKASFIESEPVCKHLIKTYDINYFAKYQILNNVKLNGRAYCF
jgi:hypothetical protein